MTAEHELTDAARRAGSSVPSWLEPLLTKARRLGAELTSPVVGDIRAVWSVPLVPRKDWDGRPEYMHRTLADQLAFRGLLVASPEDDSRWRWDDRYSLADDWPVHKGSDALAVFLEYCDMDLPATVAVERALGAGFYVTLSYRAVDGAGWTERAIALASRARTRLQLVYSAVLDIDVTGPYAAQAVADLQQNGFRQVLGPVNAWRMACQVSV